MATVYSLICFGGKDGKTVTMTIASPCVVTLTNHGLRNGTGVVLTTSGALPTGVVSGTTYYARWVSRTTFHLYDTYAHAIDTGSTTGRVNSSGSQSGTHTIKSDYWVNTLDATAKLRYGSVGSERAYDSLATWHSGRSAANAIDTEVCEIGMAWTDFLTNTSNNPALTVNLPCSSVLITPTVDGTYTDAYHNGSVSVPGSGATHYGYAFTHTVYYCDGALKVTGPRVTVEGITGLTSQISGQEQNSTIFWQDGAYGVFKNCIAVGLGASATGARCGFYGHGNAFEMSNNIAVGFDGTSSIGFQMYDYFNAYAMWANNLAVKGTVGFKTNANVSQSPTSGLWFYNNIAVGNTTNWSTFTATTWYQAGYNCGASGDTPWYKTTDTGIKTMTTSHFLDYANNDFRPAASVTVTMTIASPCVVTKASHGYADGTGVRFSTSGALPTGVVSGTQYYIRADVSLTEVDEFWLYDTAAHAVAGGATGRVASSGSQSGTHKLIFCPQVDAAATISTITAEDIKHAERPNYDNGNTEAWDCGPFEFDHGFTRPEVHTIDFTGLVAGSQVVVFTTGTTTELFRDNSSSTSESYDAAAAGVTVDYTVMKAGYLPLRVTGVSLAATATPIAIVQVADRAYVASSGLTFTTNATANTSTKIFSINAATTGQNWYSFMIEAWIAQASLANVAFPLTVNGPNSVTLGNGWEWRGWASSQTQGTGISNTSLALLTRDGMRYVAANGTVNAIWAAILTLDTEAGLQVKYRQATAGTITSASATGPMDQLVQVFGTASYGNFDYRDHMVLKVQKVGYSQPKPDLVATYGNLEDQFYVVGLDPELQYTTTNSSVANLAFDNTAKTAIISASRSVLELYQGWQYWGNQDAQWDADLPLTANTSGTTFTIPTGWTLSGMGYITGTQTLTGGTITLAGPGTYTPAFSSTTLTAQGEGTYVFTATSTIITFAPTAAAVTYVLGGGTFSGTIDLRNTHATREITVELPAGTSYTTANNTGDTITVTLPQVYQSVTVTGAVSGSRIQIYDTTSSTELYNGTPSFPYTWTDGTPAAATRAIRLRVAKMSTTTAKAFIDVNIGTCATSGSGKDVSYLVSQEDDATYNSNAIDGSGVTGITIGVGPNRVSISIAGGSVTWPSIYAYQVYWQATATGIAQETAFIEAPDTANYLLTDFDIRNTHANPLTITGGWGRDSTTLTVAGCIDSTGSTGNIYPEPDHVVAFATGSALTAGQAAELTAAAASSATAATAADAAETAATAAETAAVLARKLLSNKRVLNPATGIETIYDDNGTALYTRNVYEDAAGATAYDGTAAPHRVDKYT